MYNGYPIDAVMPKGALKLGIEHVGKTGIVGRGVLLDVAGIRGGPLPLGSTIRPADLEAAEKQHALRVEEGDIVFIRNGGGMSNTHKPGTGLHASCLPWLRERGVSVLSSDSDSDVHPPPANLLRWVKPIHMVGIPYGADTAGQCRFGRPGRGLCSGETMDLLRKRGALASQGRHRVCGGPPRDVLMSTSAIANRSAAAVQDCLPPTSHSELMPPSAP